MWVKPRQTVAADLTTPEKRKEQIHKVWTAYYSTWQPAAALVIQAKHWRKAIVNIQRWWRGHRARRGWARKLRNFRWRVEAATEIQRHVRGYLARTRVRRLKLRRPRPQPLAVLTGRPELKGDVDSIKSSTALPSQQAALDPQDVHDLHVKSALISAPSAPPSSAPPAQSSVLALLKGRLSVQPPLAPAAPPFLYAPSAQSPKKLISFKSSKDEVEMDLDLHTPPREPHMQPPVLSSTDSEPASSSHPPAILKTVLSEPRVPPTAITSNQKLTAPSHLTNISIQTSTSASTSSTSAELGELKCHQQCNLQSPTSPTFDRLSRPELNPLLASTLVLPSSPETAEKLIYSSTPSTLTPRPATTTQKVQPTMTSLKTLGPLKAPPPGVKPGALLMQQSRLLQPTTSVVTTRSLTLSSSSIRSSLPAPMQSACGSQAAPMTSGPAKSMPTASKSTAKAAGEGMIASKDPGSRPTQAWGEDPPQRLQRSATTAAGKQATKASPPVFQRSSTYSRPGTSNKVVSAGAIGQRANTPLSQGKVQGTKFKIAVFASTARDI
ncbi:hypothetical protein CEUSTIGMA_g589.t1 [Chlamydomonas eustigma]|uniref:Uncharacterized protein n=1 Tax=Chlamydomonas eustigma TaxID=1157962 RepID=A0A250WR11_9CHLO|nr:hypothetical protein CEUSTIGMA_g589.t1 [Chlamydomonas eustigma]|eukprot:GAX73136.1 hypothetical protein CEUSTIGMA_g589.t1 [Chlamydomonas eustigma]